MNEAAFLMNVNECGKLLKKTGLLKKENYYNKGKASRKKYSDKTLIVRHKQEYYDIYRCAIENDDYDFLLLDGSFFQFSLDIENSSENIRMAFYPSVCKVQYKDFLIEQLGISEEEVGAEYVELYQQFIIEQEPNVVTAFRYDYNAKLYKKFVHSSAHFHFGNKEDIRLPVNKKIRPVLFVKMAIEYYYYELWKSLIETDENIVYNNRDFEDIDKKYFSTEDEKIPFINIKRR